MYTSIKKIFAILTFATSTSIASAQLSIDDYRKSKNSVDTKIYLAGVGQGMLHSNIYFEKLTNTQLYCQPGKLALGVENYIQIIDTEIKNDSAFYKADLPVEMALLAGLIRTFPCK